MAAATLPRGLLLISLAALLLPLASALTITDFRITANSFPVIAISPSHEQQVDISFTTDTSVSFVLLNLSSLHGDPRVAASYMSTRVELSRCAKNATTGTAACTLKLLIRPSNATARITYQLWSGGKMSPGELTQTFTFDNSSPHLVGFMTGACDQGRCFIGNNALTNVTATLDDPDGSFNERQLFLQVGSSVLPAAACSGNACTAAFRISCNDMARVPATLTSMNGIQSQDDAGNPVANPGNATMLICDARPPQVVGLTANGTGPLGIVAEDGRLQIRAVVRDTVSRVTMAANTSAVQLNVSPNTTMTIQCASLKNGTQECILAVGNLKNGKNFAVPLTFTDQVGNTVKRSLTIPSIFKAANRSATPSFFTAKATKVTPATINRATLALALGNGLEYPVYVTYGFRQLAPDTAIIRQELEATKCEVALNATKGGDPYDASRAENWTLMPALFKAPVGILDQAADWNKQNRLDAKLLDKAVADWKSDQVLVRCPLKLVVRKGNTYYPAAEEELLAWPLTLRDSKLGTPGQAFLTKIDREQRDLDSGAGKLIGDLSTLKQTMGQICQLQDLFSNLQDSGKAIEMLGWALSFSPAGPPLVKAGLSMTLAGLKPSEAGAITSSGDNGPLARACKYIHCDTAANMKEGSWLTDTTGEQGFASIFTKGAQSGDSETVANAKNFWKDYAGDLTTPDVGNSLIMSIATGCIGGVVDNLEKYREVDCGYLLCLKEQAHAGASVTPCELGRSVKLCRFVVGEVFEMPYVRVIKNLAASVNQIVQAPLVFLAQVLFKSPCAKEDQNPTVYGFACRILKSLTLQKDFRSITQFNYKYIAGPERSLCDAALCTGDKCSYETSSYLGQILPGSWLSGDQYRQAQMLKESYKQEAQKASPYQTAIDALKTDKGGYDPKNYQLLHSYWLKNAGDKKNDANAEAAFFNQAANCGTANCGKDFAAVIAAAGGMNLPVTTDDLKKLMDVHREYAQGFQAFSGFFAKTETTKQVTDCINTQWSGPTCNALRQQYDKLQTDLKKSSLEYCPDKQQVCPGNCQATKCYTKEQADEELKKLPSSLNWDRAFNVLIDSFLTVGIQYLQEQGKLQFLYASGLGDWYGGAAASIGEYLDPEQLKMNLCSPAGMFSDYTEEQGSVYTLQSNVYRPVLTFAGETLPLEGYYLYTVSGVVASPYKEETMTVTLEPGSRLVTLGGQSSLMVPKGDTPMSFSEIVNDTKAFTRICIHFTEPFPEKDDDAKGYCRDLAANAYSRGGPGGEMPDFGAEDPYAPIRGASSSGIGLPLGGSYGNYGGTPK